MTVALDGADLPGTATITRRDDQLMAMRVADDMFILDSSRGCYVGLNPTAAFVWEALDQPRTLDDLVFRATAAFSGDAPSIRHDLDALLRRLHTIGLIVIQP